MSFEEEYNYHYITTWAVVDEYIASNDVFEALLREVKELSRKKPDATMSKAKVKIVNRVLENLLTVLEGQPEAKYLETLDDDELPQVSDAVLIMVQFKSALESFYDRYVQYVDGSKKWVTKELLARLREEYEEYAEEDE
ncbi:hypothetical protein [Ruegeria arenilitoris]|uniref:hypothetical protein n=1 Tax=Ruegeria arenilitoris TaxID=1173585 RepID=UPI0020C35F8E|nr:hypothetical protein [Ruegeria arenilitoris]